MSTIDTLIVMLQELQTRQKKIREAILQLISYVEQLQVNHTEDTL